MEDLWPTEQKYHQAHQAGIVCNLSKLKYKPEISQGLFKITKQLSEKFDEIQHCVWDTIWLNEFVQHQSSKSTLFIEVEKGFEESIFYF